MAPRVFLSYSQDSAEHNARVLALADRLRADGIDAAIDQYEPFPPRGWIRWMDEQLAKSDFVVVVCTAGYGGGRGTTHERAMIEQVLYNERGTNAKFVPVVFGAEDLAHIPLELQRYSHFVLDAQYDDLHRLFTGDPRVRKPELAARDAKVDFRNAVWNVPARNTCFTGRDAELAAIERVLGGGSAAALSGIGGVGKTQTAIEYAHRHRAEYEAVLWTTVEGFAGLAQTLDLREKDAKEQSALIAAVQRWFRLNSGWLLVVDNVDSTDELRQVREVMPSGGHVLITTRLNTCGPLAECIDVREMGVEEAAEFLVRRAGLPEAEREAAAEIAREVDGLPLALDQAGAFIQETPSTAAEYLRLYRTEGEQLRKMRGELAGDHASVTVTFSLAFSRLEAKNAPAADVVRACAFLAPDAIPETILTSGAQHMGEQIARLRPLEFAEALRDAGRFALVRRDAAAKTLDMHRQVQDVIKDGMEEETQRLWASRVVDGMVEALPALDFNTWGVFDAFLPHARVAIESARILGLDSDRAIALLSQTGCFLSDRGEYREAESLQLRGLELREKASGPDACETATALNNLATLYDNCGRYDRAEALYKRAVAIVEERLGPEHEDTALYVNNLAALYFAQERYAEAEPLYNQAMQIRTKLYGPDDVSTATVAHNLAALYRHQGRNELAEEYDRRALAVYEKTLGPEHPNTSFALESLAILYHNTGRYEEAEALYRRALEIRKKAVGARHPLTAKSLHNLATLYDELERYVEAYPLSKRAVAAAVETLGEDHPETQVMKTTFALIREKMNFRKPV